MKNTIFICRSKKKDECGHFIRFCVTEENNGFCIWCLCSDILNIEDQFVQWVAYRDTAICNCYEIANDLKETT